MKKFGYHGDKHPNYCLGGKTHKIIEYFDGWFCQTEELWYFFAETRNGMRIYRTQKPGKSKSFI